MIRYTTVLLGSHGPAEMPHHHSHAGQRSQRSEVKSPRLLGALYSGPCTAIMADLILKSHTIFLGFPSCGLRTAGGTAERLEAAGDESRVTHLARGLVLDFQGFLHDLCFTVPRMTPPSLGTVRLSGNFLDLKAWRPAVKGLMEPKGISTPRWCSPFPRPLCGKGRVTSYFGPCCRTPSSRRSSLHFHQIGCACLWEAYCLLTPAPRRTGRKVTGPSPDIPAIPLV